MRTARFFTAASVPIVVLLASGCKSEPQPQPQPQPQPVVRASSPAPARRVTPAPQASPPPSQSAPPPAAQPAAAPQGQGYNKVVFLNGFTRADSDRTWQAIERSGEFSEVVSGGGTDDRVVLELKYHGSDLKVSLSRILRDLGVRAHCNEGQLRHHIEVMRD